MLFFGDIRNVIVVVMFVGVGYKLWFVLGIVIWFVGELIIEGVIVFIKMLVEINFVVVVLVRDVIVFLVVV